jgi:prepilin-type N-terminal cleavage/methylation domain-containing protein
LRRLLRRLRTRPDERGYTLIEMMIATGLLALVSTAAFGAVNVMSNQAMMTTDRFTAQSEGQTIADRITKDLRTAVAPTSTTAAFASAGANDIVFYANLSDLSLPASPGPVRLHAYATLVAGTSVYVFHEDATPATGTVGSYSYTGTPLSRIDGQYVDTSQPMFTFYDSHGTQIPAPTPITTNSILQGIDSVGITLRIRVHVHSPVVVISTRIHVRNVDYNPNT